MEKSDLEKKKASEDLDIDFDEAMELFSEETLDSMKMAHVIGGTGEDLNYVCPTNAYCPTNDCKVCTAKTTECMKRNCI